MEIRDLGSAMQFAVVVQPRASRTEIVGEHGGALKLRVAAPPVDGAANEELIRFLARSLSVPQSAVRVLRGSTGRRKVVEVAGISAADVRALLSS
jgi:uncharacterized protein (TIGR00251 family)